MKYIDLRIVTFEQAKKLKELGYPQKINSVSYYNEHGEFLGGDHVIWKHSVKFNLFYAAPTINAANRWLSEHNHQIVFL